MYTELFDPTAAPFKYHWYIGLAPPFVPLAVKVTVVPSHIVEADADAVIVGVTTGLTFITMLFDVAVIGEAQAVVEVNMAETTSPFAKVEEAKVDALFPCATPFTYHS